MRRIISLAAFLALMFWPLVSVHAQVSIEQQFIDAAQELNNEQRAEFIELLRDPSDLGIAVEDLGIPADLSDRLTEVLPARAEAAEGALNRITKKIDAIDTKVEHKLSHIKEQQAGKADKTLEKAIQKAAKAAAKAEKKLDKESSSADESSTEESSKDKDKDKDK